MVANTGFYPDVLHRAGGSWDVSECEPINAAVDLHNRKAMVPRALTEIDKAIQNHEYGHVRITDKRERNDTGFSKFQYFLEECRVNMWLGHNDIKYDIALDGFDWSKMPRPTDRLNGALQWLQVSTYILFRKTRPADLQLFMADCQGLMLAEHVNGRTISDLAVLTHAVNTLRKDLRKAKRDELARTLDEHFAPPPPPEKPPATKPEYDAERAEEMKRIEKAEEKAAEKEQEGAKLKGEDATRLGYMDIHRHITRQKPGRRIAQPFGSSETGIIPTQFARRAIDGKLFKKKKATGCIIIDCSGSMVWDYGQLRALIKTLPNLTIATYQGYRERGKKVCGRLCVIASNGRWSEPTREPGHNDGNEVDYEALQWGAKVTDGPVIWLSDGDVVGGPRTAQETRRLCDALMRKRGIIRLPSSAAAVEYFSRRMVVAYKECGNKRTVKARLH